MEICIMCAAQNEIEEEETELLNVPSTEKLTRSEKSQALMQSFTERFHFTHDT